MSTASSSELWTVGEATGGMPDGGLFHAIMTLGYDPASRRFVGPFIASMMTHLWPYNGAFDVDPEGLTLDSAGPSFTGEDGQWHPFMQAHSRRMKEPKS